MTSFFLWSGNNEGLGFHPMDWDKVTQHVIEGGLGLQDLNLQSKDLLTNLVWCFHTQPDSSWPRILSQKYLRNTAFRNCYPKAKDYVLWKHMLQNKHHILDHLCWSVRMELALTPFLARKIDYPTLAVR
ncbi:hypothetical protein AAC387_Pa11g1130 [Persea americana]